MNFQLTSPRKSNSISSFWISAGGAVLLLAPATPIQSAPPQLTTLAVSAGDIHALALRSDGTVWAWGTNRIGELGLGGTLLTPFPMHISRLSNMVGIAAGPLHSVTVQSS